MRKLAQDSFGGRRIIDYHSGQALALLYVRLKCQDVYFAFRQSEEELPQRARLIFNRYGELLSLSPSCLSSQFTIPPDGRGCCDKVYTPGSQFMFNCRIGGIALFRFPHTFFSLCPGVSRRASPGIIRDTQGAAVPHAGVEVMSLETNEVNRTVSNESGYYSAPSLAIGFYRVTITATGFKKAERNRMELRSGDQVQLDFTLELGAVQETIEVTGEAELLQTLATDKGQVVDAVNVEDTPSVGRNPFLLGVIASGVQFDIGAGPLSRAVRPFDAGNNVAESMSINGGRLGASDLLLDGLSRTPARKRLPRPIWALFQKLSRRRATVPYPDQQLRCAVWTNLRGHHFPQHQVGNQRLSRDTLRICSQHHPERQHLRPESHRKTAQRLPPKPARRRAGWSAGHPPPLRRS